MRPTGSLLPLTAAGLLLTAGVAVAAAGSPPGRLTGRPPTGVARTGTPRAATVPAAVARRLPMSAAVGSPVLGAARPARAPAGPAVPGRPWWWPLQPRPVVLERFRVGPHPWSPGHRGVDLAARPGQPVLAPADGLVGFSGTVAGRGVLVLDHPGGIRTSFEPVLDGLPTGTRVRRGERVAVLGPAALSHCTGSGTGCLHWGARRGRVYVDPLLLLGLAPPIVLLPVR